MLKWSTGFTAVFIALAMASPAFAQRAIILVRHAEKAPGDGDVPLSAEGKARADRLAVHLKDAGITTIVTSEVKRTQQTAAPAAIALHITPEVRSATESSSAFKQALAAKHPDGVILVVGHSNTIPPLIDALLGHASGVKIQDAEYGHLFVLVRKADGAWGLVRAQY